jgi:DNA-binding protein HU-beta
LEFEQEGDERSMSKAQIASHLGERCQLPPKLCLSILDELATLAARQARNGFVLPGVGKLVVVQRKARMGHGNDGRTIRIPAKGVLKFRIAKAMKEAILGPLKSSPPRPS